MEKNNNYCMKFWINKLARMHTKRAGLDLEWKTECKLRRDKNEWVYPLIGERSKSVQRD